MYRHVKLLGFFAATLLVAACGKGTPSYSVLSEGETFSQATVNTKMDILWVVDQSGSMATSQQNIADNFTAFIGDFTTKGYDFKIAVTTSDAFLAMDLPGYASFYSSHLSLFEGLGQSYKARFRDGVGSNHSGQYVITPSTPNLVNAFITNILQGTAGWGDERPLMSFKAALDSIHNQGFLRDDSYLAIILVTDEDDFSHDGLTYLENQYTNPALHTIQSYVDYLDQLTGTSGALRRYQVHSISINDQTCLDQLNSGFTGRKIAQRVKEMADATGGIKGDLCGNFATTLGDISSQIIQLATRFFLTVVPVPETIQVTVNGSLVPSALTNPGPTTGGWTYDASTNSISFSGDHVPPQGASIQITFDPENVEF